MRYALISDIHANLAALEAVLADIGARNDVEAIYHLVYMIYLDEVVDDIELEVAAIFAQTLGFRNSVVSDLFKAIATTSQDYDETYPRNVRAEVLDFLALNEV